MSSAETGMRKIKSICIDWHTDAIGEQDQMAGKTDYVARLPWHNPGH